MENIHDFDIQKQTTIPHQKNIYKPLFYVILGLFLVSIIIVGTFLITKNKYSTTTATQEMTPAITNTHVITDETQNWKTYQNNELGFLIKYHSDFTLFESTSETKSTKEIVKLLYRYEPKIIGDIPNINISILDIEILKGNSLESWFTKNNRTNEYDAKYEHIQLNGIDCLKTYISDGPSLVRDVYIPHNGKIYVISSNQPFPNDDQIFKQTYSTFKFIESSVSTNNTQNLKTYTNTIYKYSLEYPNNWVYREFPDTKTGAGFKLLSNINQSDYSSEFITIDSSGRDVAHTKTPFVDYVKVAASLEIESGYEKIFSNEKIVTKYGDVGYKVIWSGSNRSGQKINQLPITYFDAKNNKNETIQIRLQDEKYIDQYNNLIKNFKFN